MRIGPFETGRVHCMDCLAGMKQLPDNCIDTICTDPPYGIRFMGAAWDGKDIRRQVETQTGGRRPPSGALSAGKYDRGPSAGRAFYEWSCAWATEAIRVAKPGAMLMAFGGTRTFHRLFCGIEDAGWEIRDTIIWMHGGGLTKSLNISKAIDEGDPAANIWDGWGTCLKPAFEPICLAMKPLEGTFAENARKWGVAGLWVDGGRFGKGDGGDRAGEATASKRYTKQGGTDFAQMPGPRGGSVRGRFPSNLIHDGSENVIEVFEQVGDRKVGGSPTKRFRDKTRNVFGEFKGHDCPPGIGPSNGSASRFFYCARTSQKERGASLHPTIKPLALMRYLIRLTRTPEGGVVLDPFAGTGTTGAACYSEEREFIGYEKDKEYAAQADDRVVAACKGITLAEYRLGQRTLFP